MKAQLKSKHMPDDIYNIEFCGWYDDSTPAFRISKNGEPFMTPTVCLAEYGTRPMNGHVFIKNWGSNEGILESMITAGLIGEPLHTVPAGFCEAQHCKLLTLGVLIK